MPVFLSTIPFCLITEGLFSLDNNIVAQPHSTVLLAQLTSVNCSQVFFYNKMGDKKEPTGHSLSCEDGKTNSPSFTSHDLLQSLLWSRTVLPTCCRKSSLVGCKAGFVPICHVLLQSFWGNGTSKGDQLYACGHESAIIHQSDPVTVAIMA